MQALYLTRHFKDVQSIRLPLADLAVPQIRSGECLIQIHSSAVNPSDALGAMGYFAHAKLPRIPGRDFAGVVVKGPAQCIGKKVWGTGGAAGLDFDGTHAEFIALPESAMAEIPNNLSVLQAGIQTLPFVTAYYSLCTRAQIQAQESVLVIGALGQVGRAAMSIAKWKQCKPFALVRKESLSAAKALGWESFATMPDRSFDVILNPVGNIYWKELLPKMSKWGRLIVIGAPEGKREVDFSLFEFYRQNLNFLGVNTVDLDFTQNAQLLNALKPGFESGSLIPLATDASTLFPLEKAELAYRRVLEKGNDKRVSLVILS